MSAPKVGSRKGNLFADVGLCACAVSTHPRPEVSSLGAVLRQINDKPYFSL